MNIPNDCQMCNAYQNEGVAERCPTHQQEYEAYLDQLLAEQEDRVNECVDRELERIAEAY